MYLFCHGLLGYGLCVLGVWIIWRRWRTDCLRTWDILVGLILHVLAAAVIWHGFVVAQEFI
jgi:hypothetical protein